jgi:hypothetical protein
MIKKCLIPSNKSFYVMLKITHTEGGELYDLPRTHTTSGKS